MALLLGPILRHVDDTTATVWVQTDKPAEVEVLGCTAHTFEVHGFHYALVVVEGLTPDSITEYRVHVDGVQVWPEADSQFPPSVIRTRGPSTDDLVRVVFGSCRYPTTGDAKLDAKLGHDALDCYATRMTVTPVEQWPEVMILLGDQVYADELPPIVLRQLLASRPSTDKDLPNEVVNFAEYEALYRNTWGANPKTRWILSTLPIAMIFDDHDICDDWNTSAAWRSTVNKKPWWRGRIRSGLAAYWVYQHLGNLSPTELSNNEDYRKVVAADGDCWPHLADLADRADREVDGSKGIKFSYSWNVGRSRLIMLDVRNARILDGGERKLMSDPEFRWLESQLYDGLEELDHLILGTSLPWLLPPAVGDLQTVNELAASRGGRRVAEKVRQTIDLEHWPAFHDSFLHLTELLNGVATRPSRGPASVSVLSGDVHHSYAARADFPGHSSTPVHQLVCSPVHGHLPGVVKLVFKIGWSKRLARITRRWTRRFGSPTLPMSWTNDIGPLFGNTIATLSVSGRNAEVKFEQPGQSGELAVAARLSLTDSVRQPSHS